jgi:hypothetical protein
MSELIGLSGASLAEYAYLPQTPHERCSAGISRRASALWLIASILMTIHAVLLQALPWIRHATR